MFRHCHIVPGTAAFLAAVLLTRADPIWISDGSLVEDNARSHYSRYVNRRPADGEQVALNPPRFSWPYWPPSARSWENYRHSFTLQIASTADFSNPHVDMGTDLNFYNTLPTFSTSNTWFWRVGYDVGSVREDWSDVRTFTVAPDAVAWDRSGLVAPDLAGAGHPRVLFNPANKQQVRDLRDSDTESASALSNMISQADAIVQSSWYVDFPTDDAFPPPDPNFREMAHDLALVAFVLNMTNTPAYTGVVDRAVTLAAFPPGGDASPEGLRPDGDEDATQINEFLALMFDWLYDRMSPSQRQTMMDSLDWRIDHAMNTFCWREAENRGAQIRLTFFDGDENGRGIERLHLPDSTSWTTAVHQVAVPTDSEQFRVELLTYYAQGDVRWDAVSAKQNAGSAELLLNPGFTVPDDGAPAAWEFGNYNTWSQPTYDPGAGPVDAGIAGVHCDDDRDRGAWVQVAPLSTATGISFRATYRTDAFAPRYLVRENGLSGRVASHPYEAAMDSAVMGLVMYEHSAMAREWFDLMLNYIIGVGNGFGFDESWNEGAGYGTSKARWLMNATLYFDTAIADAAFERNPFYSRIGDFFSRIIPVGMPFHVWGDQASASRANHLAWFRKLAFLTGEGRFLLNWLSYGGSEFSSFRPWIEYVLPAYFARPAPVAETEFADLFPIGGWAMSATGPPSLPSTYSNGVGFVFQCRPRGGYSHSYNSDASIQLHAYGQQLNHGGSTAGGGDSYGYHTMSHSTILVDGLGQAQHPDDQARPFYGRLVAWAKGSNYTYVAGDATFCYPSEPDDYSRMNLPLDGVYEQRALPYLDYFIRHVVFLRGRYFVILDDLACSQPASFTWLYHVLPDTAFSFDPARFRVDYTVGDVPVRIQHIANTGSLSLDDRRGLLGMTNPITGEDFSAGYTHGPLCEHNLWISNQVPTKSWHFLSVVYPQPPGGAIPDIERIDDYTVRVGEDVITFGLNPANLQDVDFIVDAASARPTSNRTAQVVDGASLLTVW